MIRVAVVDGSLMDRLAVQRILSSDLEISVVGAAGDGREAVDLVFRTRPQVVTIGLEVEATDNLYAVRQIMAHCPTPILLLADPRRKQGELVAHMLAAGVLDAMEKPDLNGNRDRARTREDFIHRVKLLARVPVITHVAGKLLLQKTRPAVHRASPTCRATVAIVSSTGGPLAVARLLSALPANLAAPVLVVQHIAPGFLDGLARWFQDHCSLKVRVAADGDLAEPGMVLLAPDGKQMIVCKGGMIRLDGAPLGAGPVPSGDRLFQSVANVYEARTIGVVLTGMGRDGAIGAECIKRAGGRVIVQDEATSTIFGMPRATIETGAADAVLPIGSIGEKLVRWIEH